ncbi:MAG: type II secretion system protein N [Candidatus Sulfobium sp.]
MAHIVKKPNTLLAVNTLLAAVLTLAVLLLVRDVASVLFTSRAETAVAGKKTAVIARHRLLDYAGILKNNPFGFPAGELAPLSAAGKHQAALKTEMSLVGTVAGRRDLSYAVFADKAGKQQIFRAGEEVFGMGMLDRVEKNRVLLSSNGRETEIPLADIIAVKEIKTAYSPPRGTTRGSFGRRTGPSTYVVDQQKVLQAIDKPDQLLTDARFIPHIVGNVQQGFMLREVKPGGIYASLGLRNGDVLLRINQYNISNPEAALQAFNALKGIDRAQLDIIRQGAKMTLTYQIR